MFRILDYLTDLDWMIRKLAINIVYTLVFYCKEEIMAFKENIIEFLNILKEDQIEEIREICTHILRYLGEITEFGKIWPEGDPYEMSNENNKPKNIYNKYKNRGQGNKLNREGGSRGEPLNNRINKALNNKNNKNNNYDDSMAQKYQKEKDALNKMEKENMEKKKNYTINNDNSLNRTKQKLRRPISISIDPTDINSTINSILQQLKKIREDQLEFRKMIINLKQAEGNNFINLNERLRALEKNYPRYKRNIPNIQNNYKGDSEEQKSKDLKNNKKNNFNKNEDNIKIEEIREKFYNGKFNEALLETYQNDRYLLKLLPLIDKKIIPKIEIALLEDAISRLNKRINKLVMEGDRESINDILQFYIQLTRAKIELKLVTQLNINDALNFLKSKGNNILEEEDYNNIEAIIGSLRV
jgi:hypothetical protein